MSARLARRDILGAAAATAATATSASLASPLLGCRPPENRTSVAPRAVLRVVAAQPSIDGAGVHLARSIASRALPALDPFLLLDEIRSHDPADYEPGFPRHPHRGFETVTYMIEGAMEHQDSIGNRGRLVGGSLQWMTAGHGIVHSEMPQQDRGAFWGLQLWVNLPSRLKMTAPRYQDIAPSRVPEVGPTRTRVLAGERDGVRGPVDGIFVAPTLLDATLAPGDTFEHELLPSHTAFVYALSGGVHVGPEGSTTSVSERELAVLGSGPLVRLRAGTEPARVLLVAAAPIGEPIARRGPFVMNTEEELDQAIEDYRTGRLVAPPS